VEAGLENRVSRIQELNSGLREKDFDRNKDISGASPRVLGTSMTVSDLERLNEALHTVRRLCPVLPVLAIPWMHPKHAIDPVHEQLMGVQGASKGGVAKREGMRGWALRIGWYMLYQLRFSLMLLRLRWRFRRQIGELRHQGFDLIAKTWCFGPGRPMDDHDFYYGDLQRRLADRGVRMLLLCGDASGPDWDGFAKAHVSTSGLCRLPELCLVHPLTPIWMAWKQLLASLRLRRIAAGSHDPLVRQVSALASRDCLSLSVTCVGLFFCIGRTAVRTWHPRAFMTLYEGHGWEKCAWWGAKDTDGSCRTVGYQHTVVSPASLSLTRPYVGVKERSLPDVVLSLGQTTLELMRGGHEPYGVKLIPFGSFRRPQDASRPHPPRPSLRTVLVLPEGHFPEPELLFDFAKRVALLLPDHHFIFRCHPILPLAQFCPHLADELQKFPERFPNIEVSPYKVIEADFARSSAVLYRGSSAVLYAVLNGLKPIYLHDVNRRDVDSLSELQGWRECVSSIEEMEQVLRKYAATTAESALEEWRNAVDYVNAYVMPVDAQSIDRLLEAVGLPSKKTVT